MFPSAICRLSVPLAASIFRASIAVAEPTTVGAVDKVQAQVEATQAGQTRALVVKSEVYFRDRCHSREGARLQATLKDGTQLTLGENATVVVDEFIYDPVMSRGALSIRVVKGAFIRRGSDRRGERGDGADTHAGRGDRAARHRRLGRPNRQRLRSRRAEWRSHRDRKEGNCDLETRPGNDALRQRQTPAGGRVAGSPDEARGRLHHLQKSAGSTVGEALGLVLPQLLQAPCRHAGRMRAERNELRQGRDRWRSGAKCILRDQRESGGG
jgi:hypothetical protein